MLLSLRWRAPATWKGLRSHASFRKGLSSDIEWPVSRVRSQFVDYFSKEHGHVHYKSSPVVPLNDTSLLFANAGMNQFKTIFTGSVDPKSPLSSLKRVVNSQKCIRAGGKHNDLDDVGKDTYHHTFFEMLGTWSFGDYFKKEAIDWAFHLLVNVYKLPVDRLYASYFAGNAEEGIPEDTASKLHWLRYLPAERVLPFDKADNFWEMGESGPCGPCTEIHFDRIGGRNAAHLVNADDPDVIEIWNLVFMQFNRDFNGELCKLDREYVDTGMGLERIASILQNKRSNYDTDVFTPLFTAIQKQVRCPSYSGKVGLADASQGFRDTAYRVIADHLRTISFAIADGALPSNEGRGYVLRRILRRAVRYGMHTLGAEKGFFSKLVPTLVQEYGGDFPEIANKEAHIIAILQEEEESFSNLLVRGTKYFHKVVHDMQQSGADQISGDCAFYMYDTLGFPVDLTQLMAEEQGFSIDMDGFEQAMAEQRQRSKRGLGVKKLSDRDIPLLMPDQVVQLQQSGVASTDDSSKFDWDASSSTQIDAIISAGDLVQRTILRKQTDTVGIILKSSPFYAEGGGQVSDTGTLSMIASDGEQLVLQVLDVQNFGGYLVHTCVVDTVPDSSAATVDIGRQVLPTVDYSTRKKVAPNHTMTHVLNFSLRQVLGDEVDQKGSHVSGDKLRFDFSNSRAVKVSQIIEIEKSVNSIISSGIEVFHESIPLDQALSISGVRAVFGETYPDPVRVVSVGACPKSVLASPTDDKWKEYSIEFCGGTHLFNTRDAMAFCIIDESAIAKGVRRIIAVTGQSAMDALSRGESLSRQVKNCLLSFDHYSSSTSIKKLKKLERNLVNVRNEIDTAVISHGLKGLLRSELEQLQKRVHELKKEATALDSNRIIAAILVDVEAQYQSGKNKLVLKIDELPDTKAAKRLIEELKKISTDISFIGVSRIQGEEKFNVFAVVSESAQSKGMKADEWVSAVVAKCGGKGGGKSSMAQGSAPDPARVNLAMEEAHTYVTNFE